MVRPSKTKVCDNFNRTSRRGIRIRESMINTCQYKNPKFVNIFSIVTKIGTLNYSEVY